MYRLITLIKMMLFIAACNSVGFFIDKKESDEDRTFEEKDDANTQDEFWTDLNEDEIVDMPVNVTGIFLALACRIDKYPSANDVSVRMPCAAVNNENGQKVKLENHFLNWDWAYKRNTEEIKISKKELIDDPEWHILFTITGGKTESIINLVKNASIALRGNSNENAQGRMAMKAAVEEIVKEYPIEQQIIDGLFTRIQSEAVGLGPESVCIGDFGGNSNPGRYSIELGGCISTYKAEAILIKDDFTLLKSKPSYKWSAVATRPGAAPTIPDNAVPVGAEQNGNKLYSCQVGGKFGKVGVNYGGCDYGIGIGASGYKQEKQDFLILVQ